MPLTANVEQVNLVTTAGGWRIEIPGQAGGCCLPEPFIAAGPTLTMPAQAFRVGTATPMKLRIAGMATVDYQSLENWNVTLLETTTGLLERNVLRFSPSPGETVEASQSPRSDGGYDPLVYLETIELSR